nr:HAD family hydrolase [uncultured Gellertiella sp.]
MNTDPSLATNRRLVIFDCDGVLVDSEPVSIRVLVEAMNRAGAEVTEADAYRLFLGRSLAAVTDCLKQQYGLDADPGFLDAMRRDLYGRFRTELQPIRGILETLDRLALARCVASSSQMERIRLSLTITGLIDRLAPHLFSASMVENGKPAPDLFLHAAAAMGFSPGQCIVVEDSPAGVLAAQAAGMKVLLFTGGTHALQETYREEIRQVSPNATFDAMPDLLHLVDEV